MQRRTPFRAKQRRSPAPRRAGQRLPPELRGLDVDPRKSLGQHFLVDDDALARIVALADPKPGERVIEIGAGLGALTAPLAATGAQLLAVEIDETLCAHLRRRFAEPNVHVACVDVLALPPADLLRLAELQPPYAVVANIPYYLTALLLRHFLEAPEPPGRMVLMLQREVAASIVAPAPRMSLLGVSVQAYAQPQLAFRVAPHAFYPPPRVDSAVVRLDIRRHPALPDDPDEFFRVVRAGFSAPRKQLHNALPQRLWMAPDVAPELLRTADIDPARRAQSLSIEEWAHLTEAYIESRDRWRLAADG